MNEELNLVEILKNVPKGTEFWSRVHGCVEFLSVDENNEHYPINIKFDDNIEEISSSGKLYYDIGECILFPSKYQRNWSKFKAYLPIDTPVMTSDEGISWYLRYYAGNRKCYADGNKYISYVCKVKYEYVVPVSDFDFTNPKSNINKSI